MKKENTKLIAEEHVDAMLYAFQTLLHDFSDQLYDVKGALKSIANKQLLFKGAQKAIIKSNKKKK